MPAIALCLFCLASATGALSSAANKVADDPTQLTVDKIFAKHEFDAAAFSGRWFDEGRSYVMLEKAPTGGQNIVAVDTATGSRQVLVPAALLALPANSKPLAVEDFTFSADMSQLLIYTNSKRVWRRNTRGDYWVLDRSSRQLRQLGGPDARPSSLMFAAFSPDGQSVAYVRERSLYVEHLHSGAIQALAMADKDSIINGTFDWVYEEELNLRQGFRWSPDGKSIAYWQLDTEGVPRFPLVNNTDSLYPQITWIPYPKTGMQNSSCRVGVVRLSSGTTTWMQVPGDPRNHYIARMQWATNSSELILRQLNRLQNTCQVMQADAGTGQVRTILTETDPAWVDVHDELFWCADGKQFTWISERSGWRHIYLSDRSGALLREITTGNYDAIELLHVDQKEKCIYFIASPDDATQRYLYQVQLDGADLRRLSPADQPGTHSYRIAPSGEYAFHTYSRFGVPPVTDLIRLPSHTRVRMLADNKPLQTKLAKLRRSAPEFFRVDIGNDVQVDAWCIAPPKVDKRKRYPLFVYVYGEPAGQTVVDRWGGSTYLWHLLLAQRGYVVMSFDNHGTPAPRGRAWRKSVYRHIGILASQDQAAAVRSVLKQRPWIDPDRIGIWGWSGGGTMTLHAMFKHPDLYQTGISVAPVANERYYDTIYQERYMGLPNDNVEGYTNGSAVTYAHQLQGNLLLIHGTGDDNCHFATTEMLINELIRCNKKFRMMAYPNRTHAIRERANTTLHLRTLMTNYLLTHLPAGPK